MLSQDELNRYARQLNLPQWSEQQQLAIRETKVLLVGAGALGAPLIAYLPVMGFGQIGLVDDDKIEIHNLHRQFIYQEGQVGELKVNHAKAFIKTRNASTVVKTYPERITKSNIASIAAEYDIIVDGTDNFPTRYLINDYCVLNDKTNVHGSIEQFSGQVAVFNAPTATGRSANYRDLYPQPPAPEEVMSCEEGGVLGPLPGIVASTMAIEIVKVVTGIGTPLVNSFLRLDTLTHQYVKLNYSTDPSNPLNDPKFELSETDYPAFCGVPLATQVKSIDAQAYSTKYRRRSNHQLVDVRNPDEFATENMGGVNIPLAELSNRMAELMETDPIVVICKSGQRSKRAAEMIQSSGRDVVQLSGGLIAWKKHLLTSRKMQ